MSDPKNQSQHSDVPNMLVTGPTDAPSSPASNPLEGLSLEQCGLAVSELRRDILNLLVESRYPNVESVASAPTPSPSAAQAAEPKAQYRINMSRSEFLRHINVICGKSAASCSPQDSMSPSPSTSASPGSSESAFPGATSSPAQFPAKDVAMTLALILWRVVENAQVSKQVSHQFSGSFEVDGGLQTISSELQFSRGESVASMTIASVAATGTANVGRDFDGYRTINQYLVLQEIGTGAQGKVYVAQDTEKREMRAIKIVRRPASESEHSDATRRAQQLQHEIAIMKKCRHRNLVSLYEVIDDPQLHSLYLVMQYVEHGPVVQLAPDGTTNKTFPPNVVLSYARQLCAGLFFLHEHDVAHRDIKPENILLGTDDNIFLADFGVSEMLGDIDTQKHGVAISGTKGTRAFFAPELVDAGDEKAVDGKAADVWALGLSFYVLLCGKLPWPCDNAFRYYRHLCDDSIDLPSSLPEPWLKILRGMLEKDVEKRWDIARSRKEIKKYHQSEFSDWAADSCVASPPTIRRRDPGPSFEQPTREEQDRKPHPPASSAPTRPRSTSPARTAIRKDDADDEVPALTPISTRTAQRLTGGLHPTPPARSLDPPGTSSPTRRVSDASNEAPTEREHTSAGGFTSADDIQSGDAHSGASFGMSEQSECMPLERSHPISDEEMKRRQEALERLRAEAAKDTIETVESPDATSSDEDWK